MAQREEDVGEKDSKSELDLGIEESIRRCEALLAMVPLSLQSIIADGVSFFPSYFVYFRNFIIITKTYFGASSDSNELDLNQSNVLFNLLSRI